MKYSFFLLALIFPLLLKASTETDFLASMVLHRVEGYEVSLATLESLSNISGQNEDERTERDLAICQTIGESRGLMMTLVSSLSELDLKMTNSADRIFIDHEKVDLTKHNRAFDGFCLVSPPGDYRDVLYLQKSLKIAYEDLSQITEFAKKFLGQNSLH